MLQARGAGARTLDLVFERVDGSAQVVRIGTARPVRDPMHLARLLDERIETVDPGLGVEAMRLVLDDGKDTWLCRARHKRGYAVLGISADPCHGPTRHRREGSQWRRTIPCWSGLQPTRGRAAACRRARSEAVTP